MNNKILELSKLLISIESTKDNTEEREQVLNVVKRYLNGSIVKEYVSDGYRSLLASNNKDNKANFRVILNAHLDVVAGNSDQFVPYEKDGKLFGRGAYDMKAAAAVEILVFDELKDKVKNPLGLQIVTDEEVGGMHGTRSQVEQGITSDFVLVGEPTNLNIRNKSKGVYWMKLTTHGKKSHAAYQWNGENAVNKMLEVISDIQKSFPILEKEAWETTVTVTHIATENQTYNAVPENCEAVLDIRTVPEKNKEMIQKIINIINNRADIEFSFEDGYYHTSPDDEYVFKLNKSVKEVTDRNADVKFAHGGCDLRHYPNSTKALEFGPIGGGHHEDLEWVDIKSLQDYYRILKKFLLSLD